MTSNEHSECIEIDIRGQICPSSLLTTLKELNAIKQAKAGSVVMIIKTDNRNATVTIPEIATSMGYVINTAKENDYYKITIMKPQKITIG